MTATSVAFFRNLNLGQQRSPGTVQLLAAFAAEGATEVLSHQSKGTVAFTSPHRPAADLAEAVVERLVAVSAWDDVALVREVAWLGALGLDDLPEGREVTFMDGPDPFPDDVPFFSERAAATILRADHLHAVVQNHVERRSNGTPLVESRLEGVRATSRGAGTLQRLLVRLDAA